MESKRGKAGRGTNLNQERCKCAEDWKCSLEDFDRTLKDLWVKEESIYNQRLWPKLEQDKSIPEQHGISIRD